MCLFHRAFPFPIFLSLGVLSLTILASVAELRADVTIFERDQQGGNVSPDLLIRKLEIKGLKMRLETRRGSTVFITIYELESGRRIRLDPKHKEALVAELKMVSEQLQSQIVIKDSKREVRSTGAKGEFQGAVCQAYEFELVTRWRTAHGALLDSGTVCISESIPGGAEFADFVEEAIRRGYPAAAAACSPVHSLAGDRLYGTDLRGIAFSSKTDSRFIGGLGLTENTMNVTEVSVSSIPDDEFEVPARWKIKQDKLLGRSHFRKAFAVKSTVTCFSSAGLLLVELSP
jgi:hypothetical protein